ncbi:type II toxin-antitoxin system PemK/MazF family toxin [Salana multivorans]
MRLLDLLSAVLRVFRPERSSKPTRSATSAPPRRQATSTREQTAPSSSSSPSSSSVGTAPAAAEPGGDYPPPVLGITEYDLATMPAPRLSYAPEDDGDPDPGEIVWGWVPYEEDASQGKDRPMLVLGHGGPTGRCLVGIQLTAQDRASDGVVRRRDGRVWMDIGSGDWDRKRRPSEVRIDRLLLVEPRAVRREGGVLPRDRFDAVVEVLREHHGW